MAHTSTILNAVKTLVITGLCYGWFVPVGLVGSIVQQAYPTSELTEEWTIESVHNVTGSLPWDEASTQSNVKEEQETASINEIEITEMVKPQKVQTESSTPTATATPTPSLDTNKDTLNASEDGTSIQKPFSKIRIQDLPNRNQQSRAGSIKSKQQKCSSRADNEGITQISNTEYQLSKKIVRKYRNDWQAAQKLARLSWYSQNGEHKGIRIRGIGCSSPVQYSGLKPGDVVLSINNKPLTSEKELLATYGRLLIWKDIELSILRNGKPMTFRYSIRK